MVKPPSRKTEMETTDSHEGAPRKDAPVDLRVMKALGHPIRQKILQTLKDRVASPSEVAKEIGEPLGNVSYHFKILLQCEAVELVRTRPVRGALEHFYRASMAPRLDEKEWGALPDSIKDELIGQLLEQIWDHVTEAAAEGGFNDAKSGAVWDRYRLDDEGHAELGDLVVEMVDRATAIQAAADLRLKGRPNESDDASVHEVELNMLLFHHA